jgi:hypothetical protein
LALDTRLENLPMRPRTLTGLTMMAAALLTGCGAEPGPTAASAPSLAAARKHVTVVHSSSRTLLDETFDSPCNGESIHYTGTLFTQMTLVTADPASQDSLHGDLHMVVSETGTGLTTGALYTARDVF